VTEREMHLQFFFGFMCMKFQLQTQH